jgi:hypothetical protein
MLGLLLMGLTLKPAFAGGGADRDDTIKLYAYESLGPIGKIESFGSYIVNGRQMTGEYFIFGGEILQAPHDKSVRLSLNSIGRVTLHCGAMAKFGVTWKEMGDNLTGGVLIASLIRGNVTIKLSQTAEAYVEASGSALSASRGAVFQAGTGDEGPVFNTAEGSVGVARQTTPQGKYMIRPADGRTSIDVRLRKTRQVQFIVTDENDRPVPDVPVIITISGGAGTLGSGATTVTVTTNALGIASTPVSGAASAGTGSITASIPGGASTTVGVTAVSAGILSATTIGIIAAAAVAGTTTAIVTTQQDKKEIEQVGEPRITPSSIR